LLQFAFDFGAEAFYPKIGQFVPDPLTPLICLTIIEAGGITQHDKVQNKAQQGAKAEKYPAFPYSLFVLLCVFAVLCQ
jgi:hypothetical protein